MLAVVINMELTARCRLGIKDVFMPKRQLR
jgi:hypothetical protein